MAYLSEVATVPPACHAAGTKVVTSATCWCCWGVSGNLLFLKPRVDFSQLISKDLPGKVPEGDPRCLVKKSVKWWCAGCMSQPFHLLSPVGLQGWISLKQRNPYSAPEWGNRKPPDTTKFLEIFESLFPCTCIIIDACCPVMGLLIRLGNGAVFSVGDRWDIMSHLFLGLWKLSSCIIPEEAIRSTR